MSASDNRTFRKRPHRKSITFQDLATSNEQSNQYGTARFSETKSILKPSSILKTSKAIGDATSSSINTAKSQLSETASDISRQKAAISKTLQNVSKRGLSHMRGGSGNQPHHFKSENINEIAIQKFAGEEGMKAAAAIVQASSSAASGKAVVHYSIGDKCLAYLSILNNTLPSFSSSYISDASDTDFRITKYPVNKYGFPHGWGFKVEEQRGPYHYVICTIKIVHFDEDARYYTVTRLDNGRDQRAEAAWLEPILSEEGKAAALRAAKADSLKKYHRSDGIKSEIQHPFLRKLVNVLYIHPRRCLKRHTLFLLIGNLPYSIITKFSTINFLVICSLMFNFLDQIRLVVPTQSHDVTFAVFCVFVWFVLASEIIMEISMRPTGYSSILNTENRYDPSIARYIDSFHLWTEIFALLFFLPELHGIFTHQWDKAFSSSLLHSTVSFLNGPREKILLSLLSFAAIRFRVICFIRHCKQCYISRSYSTSNVESNQVLNELSSPITKEKNLKDAARIGSALVIVNSRRIMIIIILIVASTPYFGSFVHFYTFNGLNNTNLLQASNTAFVNNDDESCELLEQSIQFWLDSTVPQPTYVYDLIFFHTQPDLVWAQLLPIRCEFQKYHQGVVTQCSYPDQYPDSICHTWNKFNVNATASTISNTLDLRYGSLTTQTQFNTINDQIYNVTAIYNEQGHISMMNFSSILLQLILIITTFLNLGILSFDLTRIVLNPLYRMIEIVLVYSKNPLATAPSSLGKKRTSYLLQSFSHSGEETKITHLKEETKALETKALETKQLINTITKITDLLRKCWGVAGANIISSNLAKQETGWITNFNPCVPGKSVYALFGFAAITQFSSLLHKLNEDIMILINDVAAVVHDEVFRWGYGSSGQCNKNLGSCFLLVFRIGDFQEVSKNKKIASEMMFASFVKNKKKSKKVANKKEKVFRNDKKTISLIQLPGITNFTDRALVGMLKSFAGINRDRRVLSWCNDWRLSAGVEPFTLKMIFGMDAGWAVEGAVGSEYKVDATYLSPHVNMASRMMSACNQFKLTILVSQAVQELVSEECRSKLRHIDTITVKGSTVEQKIFTYDARETGVNFFLFDRTEEEADWQSDQFTSQIWNTDQDLRGMREHISEEFLNNYELGRDLYLEGKWCKAIEQLKKANEAMIQTVLDRGYLSSSGDDFSLTSEQEKSNIKELIGDGPCKSLINYMQRRGGIAPSDWKGFRPLTSK